MGCFPHAKSACNIKARFKVLQQASKATRSTVYPNKELQLEYAVGNVCRRRKKLFFMQSLVIKQKITEVHKAHVPQCHPQAFHPSPNDGK